MWERRSRPECTLETVLKTLHALTLAASISLGLLASASVQAQVPAQGPNFPITAQQKATAQQVSEAGVPLSELAPNAPDSHTVKRGDTLWGISGLFLKSPWRWPELWGMNLQQIRNPHLIFPGQVLYLDKSNGRARLRLGTPLSSGTSGGDVKLSPRVREGSLTDAIATVPVHLLEPFFNEAVIFNNGDELVKAPRVIATQEGRVLASRGESVYVRGDTEGRKEFRLFREPKPLRDPDSREVLGYEAQYVGAGDLTREGVEGTGADGNPLIVPGTVQVTRVRQEVMVGDRLSPVPAREFESVVPHAPAQMAGAIVSIYGEALTAGQNQIVVINRGTRDGMEKGHVLALWRAGAEIRDITDPDKRRVKLPDERHGLLYVFRPFEKMSYALILSVQEPVKPGDRFTQP
jgi:LysM domain